MIAKKQIVRRKIQRTDKFVDRGVALKDTHTLIKEGVNRMMSYIRRQTDKRYYQVIIDEHTFSRQSCIQTGDDQ